MPTKLDKMAIEQFMWILGYANHVEPVLDRAIRETCGLSLPEKDLLGQIKMSGGRLKMHQLSELLLFSPGGMTRLVDRLIKENLIVRATEPNDRRIVYVELTDAGSELLAKAQPIIHDVISRTFADHIHPSDAQKLKDIMTKILKGNGVWDQIPKLTG